MPPASKRKTSKGRDGSAGAATDVAMGPPPAGRSLVRHSDSELSGSDVEGKKFKPGTPLAGRSAVSAAVAASAAEDGVAAVGASTSVVLSDAASDGATEANARKSRSRAKAYKSVKSADTGAGVVSFGVVESMGKVTDELLNLVCDFAVPSSDLSRLVAVTRKYEQLVVGLLLENAEMKGKLAVYETVGVKSPASAAALQVGVPQTPAPVAVPRSVGLSGGSAASVPAPKAVETWSVVVKGKGTKSSKEVVDKVVGEVAPALGVRVHGILPTRDGGAVIRTRSVDERRKILDNKKFGEAGLEVSVNEKLGPRIMVQKVDTLVSPEEFMEDLYAMNLGEIMSKEAFKKSVKMVSPLWKEKEGLTNVQLECTERVAEHLRASGVYVKWFRFLVRIQDAVMACHRCCGFDHRVKDCRLKEDICRLCGQGGHLASRCTNPAHCRNCALRRCPADHPMLSMQCPVYAAMVARANARH